MKVMQYSNNNKKIKIKNKKVRTRKKTKKSSAAGRKQEKMTVTHETFLSKIVKFVDKIHW